MTDDVDPGRALRMEVANGIVTAYVANNPIPRSDLPHLIATVHATLAGLSSPSRAVPAVPRAEPAVPVRKSVGHDAVTCLTCGRRFKTLKRHLMADHDMTPADYRAAWDLRPDYPMVAPAYAEMRSELAVRLQLGRQRRRRPSDAAQA